MAIANATTEVDVDKTVGEVMALVRRLKARSVMVRYGPDESPSGVGFELVTDHGPRSFELPVQVDGVQAALRGEVPPRMQTRAHATRVAWRIAKDWLRAQVALTEARIATPVQVMLPYLVVERTDEDGHTHVTLYDRYLTAAEGALQLPRGSS